MRPRVYLPPEQRREVADLFACGCSTLDIAKLFDVTDQTVYSIAAEYGVSAWMH